MNISSTVTQSKLNALTFHERRRQMSCIRHCHIFVFIAIIFGLAGCSPSPERMKEDARSITVKELALYAIKPTSQDAWDKGELRFLIEAIQATSEEGEVACNALQAMLRKLQQRRDEFRKSGQEEKAKEMEDALQPVIQALMTMEEANRSGSFKKVKTDSLGGLPLNLPFEKILRNGFFDSVETNVEMKTTQKDTHILVTFNCKKKFPDTSASSKPKEDQIPSGTLEVLLSFNIVYTHKGYSIVSWKGTSIVNGKAKEFHNIGWLLNLFNDIHKLPQLDDEGKCQTGLIQYYRTQLPDYK